MQELPDHFNDKSYAETSDSNREAVSTRYEPINADARESSTRYPNVSMLSIMPFLLLALFTLVTLSAVFADGSFEDILPNFAGKSKLTEAVDTNQFNAEKKFYALSAQYVESIAQLKGSISAVREDFGVVKASLTENDARIARLERDIGQISKDIIKVNSQRAVPKSVTVIKPIAPSKPQIFVSLVSIRSQGGSAWVTLREGFDTSPLLAIGDEWRAVKLVSADTENKSAQISINGALSVAKL